MIDTEINKQINDAEATLDELKQQVNYEKRRLRRTFSKELFTDKFVEFLNSLNKSEMRRFAVIMKTQAEKFRKDSDLRPSELNPHWFVYYHDMNAQVMKTLDIFRHRYFSEQVTRHLSECATRDEFAEKLKRDLQYNFWCKSEYEVIIKPWCGDYNTNALKVDIYSQVMLNFDIFVDYLWGFRRVGHKRG